jgi:hypothetical protein
MNGSLFSQSTKAVTLTERQSLSGPRVTHTMAEEQGRPTVQPHGFNLQNQPQKVKIMVLKWEITKDSYPNQIRLKNIETIMYQN